MSGIEGALASFGINRIQQSSAENMLEKLLMMLNLNITNLIKLQPEYISFLKSSDDSLEADESDGTIITKGRIVPEGSIGVIENIDINFTTTGGNVRVVILNESDEIRLDILRDVNSNTNGAGKIVLDSGERIAIAGQSSGNGVFSAYFSGFLQKKIPRGELGV